MTDNYYTLKREASRILLKYLAFLKENKENGLKISAITLEFQEKLGFSEKTVRTMLQTYVDLKQIKISGDEINAT